jgi:hypothetical protein
MRPLLQDLMLFNADPTDWLETTFPASVDNVLATVLNWPGFAVLGVLGLALGALSFGRTEDDYDSDPDRIPDRRGGMRG